MAKYFLIFGLLVGTDNTEIFGQSLPPIQCDRPDQTECPFIVPKNHFQMENGFSFEQTDDKTQSYFHPSSLLKYGINNQLELRLITESTTIHSGSQSLTGLSPIKVGFKINMVQDNGIIPRTSFITHLTIPYFASDNFKSTYFAPSFRFTMQHELTEKLGLGYNLGAEWDGESAEPIFIYTLTTGYSFTSKAGGYIELYGFAPQKSQPDHRFDCGFIYLLRPNILLDISGGIGLTDNAQKYYLALGFSFRLKN